MRDLWQARAHAAIAVASGAPEAPASLASLADAFEAAGFLEDAAWARVDLGRMLGDAGDRAAAVTAYSDAAALADRGGAAGVGRLANRALRALGVRTWKRAAAARGGPGDVLGQLTGRELEVARLVAGGASNREISETLGVSPKTVERHVTNILAKLDLRNRTELARLVYAGPGTGFPR
jgi:DNA-binding CsgD family transcriptional regulator